MALPDLVSDREWLAARRRLLAKEQELVRLRDELAAERRRLPAIRIEKDYPFEGPDGRASLLDLFADKRQLLVQHFMFDPSWDKGCPYCSAIAEEYGAGIHAHLSDRDTAFAAVSRAPYAKIAAYRQSRGWTFPWYSSYGSDFNYDFHVTHDESVRPLLFEYLTKEELTAKRATAGLGPTETGGFSCFLRDGATIYYTYSTYDDLLMGRPNELLDLTYLGRQED